MNKLPISAVGECDTCGWTRVDDFEMYIEASDYATGMDLDGSCTQCANTVTVTADDLTQSTVEWTPRPKLEFYSAIYGNKLGEV